MDFNATIDLIIKDLDEASEIIDDLKRYHDVPPLQVELAKSKCKSAADVIALLKNINKELPVIEHINTPEDIIPGTVVTPDEIKPEKVSAAEETISENVVSDTSAPLPEKTVGTTKQTGAKSGSAIIADKFSHLSNRFNEQMGTKKGDDDFSGVLQTKPLTDLSDAIGINDRFLFIRELFDGDKEAYNQAITRLNKAENIKDAMAVIMSYTGDNNENKVVNQLLDLVKRKLPYNE